MEKITYPDGEVVSYDYDSGGQINSVTGSRMGTDFEYVKDIGYDEWGRLTHMVSVTTFSWCTLIFTYTISSVGTRFRKK